MPDRKDHVTRLCDKVAQGEPISDTHIDDARKANEALLAACNRVLAAIDWGLTHERMSDNEITTLLRRAIEDAGSVPER